MKSIPDFEKFLIRPAIVCLLRFYAHGDSTGELTALLAGIKRTYPRLEYICGWVEQLYRNATKKRSSASTTRTRSRGAEMGE